MKETNKTKVRPMAVLRANKSQKAHVHNRIIEECGSRDIPYLTGANIVVLFHPELTAEDLIASLQGLERFIELRSREG